MKKLSFFVIVLFLFPAMAHAKITVVTSFSILADMTHEVGGDSIHLVNIVGAGSDAHAYEPTPADAKLIAHADVVIINGAGFESWFERLVQSSGYKGPVVIATQGVKLLPFGPNSTDPHAWQSIVNGEIYVNTIRDALIKADKNNQNIYRGNASRYIRRLDGIDAWVRRTLAEIPPEKRVLITSHDSLQYFAKEYGVKLLTPLGISTSGDPSAGDIARLIDTIRKTHVKALFLENMTDPRLMEQLATDSGAVVGGTLYTDALSKENGDAPSYIAMFWHNVSAMADAMRKD